MQKPQHYPISWKGDEVGKLLSGPELILALSKEGSVNAIYACGSQVPLLDLQFLPYSSRQLSNKVLKLLGVGAEIKVVDVLNHFNELLHWFKDRSHDEITKETFELTNTITMSIYKYLNKKLSSNKNDEVLLQQLEQFRDKECVWNGKRYLLPDRVSFNWKTSGPYLYKFPETLEVFISLMKQIGIKEDFSSDVIINALNEMKEHFGHESLSNECCEVVRLLIPKLKDIPNDADVFLPDTQFILRSVKEIKYNDAKWCPPDQKYLYCHECVERSVALHFGVEPVKSILLKDLDITEDDDSEEFGTSRRVDTKA